MTGELGRLGASLTSWEFSELLEHLSGRTDIWTQSDENPLLWLRSHDEWDDTGESTHYSDCALSFSQSGEGLFCTFSVEIMPIGWDEEYCADYLERLLQFWTERSLRLRIQEFLRTELGHDEETSEVGAIAITSFDHEGEKADPEKDAPPRQERLWPDVLRPVMPLPEEDPLDIGTWMLTDGGYLRLRLQGDMIFVEASIRSPGTDGFGPVLRGHLRPVNGRVHDTAASLRGVPNEAQADHHQPVLEEGPDELSEALRLEEDSGAGTDREEERP